MQICIVSFNRMCGKRGQSWAIIYKQQKAENIRIQGMRNCIVLYMRVDGCCIYISLHLCVQCNVTSDWNVLCACCMAYSVARWPKHTISMRNMPKIHFNNNSNFSLTHYQKHTYTQCTPHFEWKQAKTRARERERMCVCVCRSAFAAVGPKIVICATDN